MDKSNPSELERLGPEIPVKTTAVPMGLPGVNRRTVDGFVLMTGIVLLESERDGQGRYYGGAGMDGMYLRTPHLFTPVKNESGEIRAFREVLPVPVKTRKPPRRSDPER
ncbi:hypothetical protein [Caproicibacter fermentans]|uniref:Uncharacterized protein n=1 Tax=Caproicibacter fermentans TaxID=2576756 RepID=A0A7G8T9F5_9FIRM|nr:hypothetical protein [Caproicibacter fermentans]QNK40246.1 hypothetical protein HCR03_16445 [Caproicibacter fermentans]